MKVFVLGGCTTRAQVNYLKAAFPSWDVRGAIIEQATDWIATGNAKFTDFLAGVDIFFGFTDREEVARAVNPGARIVRVPSFDWSGFHPDTVWLHGMTSPMGLGVIHSRIAAASWALGRDAAGTQALFSDAHFDRCGLYDVFADDRARMEGRFRKVGFDIAPLFDRWLEWGNFLYTPNHPRTEVFFDIAHAAMMAQGLTPEATPEALAAARADFPDYLAEGIVWAVYPEVAARHGIAARPQTWRMSAARGAGEEFDLTTMIARSYAAFGSLPPDEARALIAQRLGGPEKVALYGGG